MLLLDVLAGQLDQRVVLHAGRAGGETGHAAEAAVEALDDGIRQLDRAVEAGGHQEDAATRRVGLLAPQAVGRAGGEAEPAVHAVRDDVALATQLVELRHTSTSAGIERARARARPAAARRASGRSSRLVGDVGRADADADEGRSARGEERRELAGRIRRRGRAALAWHVAHARPRPGRRSGRAPTRSAARGEPAPRHPPRRPRSAAAGGPASRGRRPSGRAASARRCARGAPPPRARRTSTATVAAAAGSGCSRRLARAIAAKRPCEPQTSLPRS